jgi:hypothetical protein
MKLYIAELPQRLNPPDQTGGVNYSAKMYVVESNNQQECVAMAVRHAETLAKANPKKQFTIFTSGDIFETTEPKVLRKKVNEFGEVVGA